MSWTRREINRWITDINRQIERSTNDSQLTVEEDEFYQVLSCLTIVLKFIRDRHPANRENLCAEAPTDGNFTKKKT